LGQQLAYATVVPLPVIASVAGGRSFYKRLHRMKRFFLSMKYLANDLKIIEMG
jgi:hypothetical protein